MRRLLRQKKLATAVVVLLIAILSALDHAGVFGYRPREAFSCDGAEAVVTYAADGDTIDVDLPDGGRPVTRIRLWGVDCPEIAHRPGEQDAYFGREATEFVRQRVVGRRVRLTLDPKRSSRDRFGRLLAYVHLIDEDRMLNELLIERGLAYADSRFAHVHKRRFMQIERQAMNQKAGLWAGVTADRMPAWRTR